LLFYIQICQSSSKVISDFLYEEELLNLRIQAPVCSDTGDNDFLAPASVGRRLGLSHALAILAPY
jgi:hypothetical protein